MERKIDLISLILVCLLMVCYGFGLYYVLFGERIMNENETLKEQCQIIVEDK